MRGLPAQPTKTITNANNGTMKEGSRTQSARNEEARGCLESTGDCHGANARGREAREVRNVRTTAYNPNDNDNDNCSESHFALSAQTATHHPSGENEHDARQRQWRQRSGAGRFFFGFGGVPFFFNSRKLHYSGRNCLRHTTASGGETPDILEG